MQQIPATLEELRKTICDSLGTDYAATLESDKASIAALASTNQKASDDATGAGKLLDPVTQNNATLGIYQSLLPVFDLNALVGDLESFAWGEVSADPTVRDRIVEQNIDDAAQYLANCIALRKEYYDLAKAKVDTTLKTQEFLLLDVIHENEVLAGLYYLPWLESANEQLGLQTAVEEATNQVAEIQALQTGGALSPASTADFTSSTASITLYSVKPAAAPGWIAAVTRRGVELDDASWGYNLHNAKIASAQLQSRWQTSIKKTQYLANDIIFRSHRADVARTVAYKQLWENIRTNSILNFDERLAATKAHFTLNAKLLVSKVLVIQRAAAALYSINIPTDPSPPPQGKIVDSCARWVTSIREAVAQRRRLERTFVFTIMLSSKIPGSSLAALAGGVAIDVAIADTGNMQGRLRGIAFEYVGADETVRRPIQLVVQPPTEVTANTNAVSPVPQNLVFGRVLPVTPALEMRPQNVDALWNGDPYHSWNIKVDSVTGVQDIAMYVWMSIA